MHGTVYNIQVCMVQYTSIQSHTEARWCDGGLCSYAICRHASWLLKGFHKPILLVILKVCAIQESTVQLQDEARRSEVGRYASTGDRDGLKHKHTCWLLNGFHNSVSLNQRYAMVKSAPYSHIEAMHEV